MDNYYCMYIKMNLEEISVNLMGSKFLIEKIATKGAQEFCTSLQSLRWYFVKINYMLYLYYNVLNIRSQVF